jgi:Leucine-rich repeat (LRR) protein
MSSNSIRGLCTGFSIHGLIANNLLFADIPPSISKLASIWRLDLSNNDISQLPNVFQKLVCLRHLNLSQNALKDLPQTFAYLRLETFSIAGNA